MAVRWEPVTLATGTLEQMDLDALASLYQPGELGELQLYLRIDLEESDRPDVEAAVLELDQQLLSRGAKPWPGEGTIASLNWGNRTVYLRFTNNPFFLALAGALVAAATIIVGLAAMVNVMEDLGVPLPEVITSWADAITVAVAIALVVLVLRRFGIPLSLLAVGGFLIFALLQPDFAWKAIKWVARQVTDVIGGILDAFLRSEAAVPLLMVAAGGVGVYLVARRDRNG